MDGPWRQAGRRAHDAMVRGEDDTRALGARTGTELRGDSAEKSPREKAEAASLREERGSVRPQAPVQDEFAKGPGAGRSGVGRDRFGPGGPDDLHGQREQNGDHETRRLEISRLDPIRDECMHRLAAFRPLRAVRGNVGWVGRAVVAAAGVLVFRGTGGRHSAEGAVIGEDQPPEQSHRGDDRAEDSAGEFRVQARRQSDADSAFGQEEAFEGAPARGQRPEVRKGMAWRGF